MLKSGADLGILFPKTFKNSYLWAFLLKTAFAFFLLTLLLGPLTTKTFAQENGNTIDLTVSPIFFDFSSNPGQIVSDKVRLRNNGSSNLNLKAEVKKLTASDVRDANLEDPKPEDQFVNWVKFEDPTIEARPKEWIDVPFTIAIPNDASFGYYFAFTFTQDQSIKTPDQPTAVILGSVAVPVLLNVKSPNAKVEGQLEEFKAKSFVNQFLPIEFDVKVKNTGNVHIKPRGNIFIRGGGEKELAILEVNEGMGNILPDGTRTFNALWDDGFIINETVEENGQTVKKMRINWNKLTSFRFGPYTANLLMVYDNGTRDVPLEASTTFWVIPYIPLAIILIGFIVLFLVMKYLLRSYVKSQLKRQKR
jgi:hypothetical protein